MASVLRMSWRFSQASFAHCYDWSHLVEVGVLQASALSCKRWENLQDIRSTDAIQLICHRQRRRVVLALPGQRWRHRQHPILRSSGGRGRCFGLLCLLLAKLVPLATNGAENGKTHAIPKPRSSITGTGIDIPWISRVFTQLLMLPDTDQPSIFEPIQATQCWVPRLAFRRV